MSRLLLDSGALPAVIIVGLLGFFGVLVLVVILIKKRFSSLQIRKDESLTEEDVAREELKRVLVPVKDEKIAAAMEADAQKNDQKDDAGKRAD